MPPLFSIVIPAYNEERFLPATIGAIRVAAAQIQGEIEIVVGNNCSSDRTAEVAVAHGARVVDVTTRCISAVRNQAAATATGKYLVFVDADDSMSPNMLSEIQKVLDSGKFIGGGVARTRYDRASLGIRLTHGIVQFGLSFTGLSMFLFYMETRAFHATGGFNEQLLSTEDYEFARRLRALGRKRGLRYKNLRSAYLVKSSRKFSEYGDWNFFLNPVLSLKAMLNDRETAYELWYKPRR